MVKKGDACQIRCGRYRDCHTGEDMDLFQAHWDVPLPPDTLVGLTVEQARKKRAERMVAAAGPH